MAALKNTSTLQIKNMVCPRCISSVEEILGQLGIRFEQISLGKAILKKPLAIKEEKRLEKLLKNKGFELITDKHRSISNRIKSLIIEWIYEEEPLRPENLSVMLSGELHRDYSHLSNIFSKTEGRSIRDFHRDVKIMRIKELLEYNELTVSEIANDLGYGNAAYLSTQFKQVTGLTPSEYKRERNERGFLNET